MINLYIKLEDGSWRYWGSYDDQDEVDAVIEALKKEWGFTEFKQRREES